MDANQWPLGLDVLKPVETTSKPPVIERKPRPQKEQALNCPRCNSTNTKFCYYNNYNLSQPRYFCKTCRRYWTEGGTLRNVPVGGGSRKNKRSSLTTNNSSSSSSSTSSILKKLPDLTNMHHPPQIPTSSQNPKFHGGGQDLNLAFDHSLHSADHVYHHTSSSSNGLPLSFGEGKGNNTSFGFDPNPNNHLMPSSLELLKEVGVSSMGLGLVGSMPLSGGGGNNNIINSAAAVLLPPPNSHTNDYFKPRFNFCLDGQLDLMGGMNYGNGLLQQQQQQQTGVALPETHTTRFFHPYEEVKQFTTTSSSNDQYEQQNKGQGESNGYWSGMLGGGSW